jgi:hypothetical protein
VSRSYSGVIGPIPVHAGTASQRCPESDC